MSSRKQIDKCNAFLARELGGSAANPLYQWKWSEDLTVRLQKLDDNRQPVFEYRADRESGLIKPEPVYVNKKQCPLLKHRWVLCRWLETPSPAEWFTLFGRAVPWPGAGYYAATNVELDEGTNPWDSLHGRTVTEWVVATAREQLAKRYQDHLQEGEEALARREKESNRILDEKIDDLKLPFAGSDHIPGQKDSVSLPTAKIAA